LRSKASQLIIQMPVHPVLVEIHLVSLENRFH